MYKILLSGLTSLLLASSVILTASARDEAYVGKCLYIDEAAEEGDFKSCQVSIQGSTIQVNFDDEDYQSGNTAISGDSVVELSSGEYAEQLLSDSASAVSGIFLGPANMVVGIFAPDRDYQQYVLRYKDADENETATVLNIERSDAPEFQQDLSIASGRVIVFREGQTNTLINVGPDLPTP